MFHLMSIPIFNFFQKGTPKRPSQHYQITLLQNLQSPQKSQ